MQDDSQPQLYLISPPQFDLASYGDILSGLLDARPVACMRLAMVDKDEDLIMRAADHLREICHARDVALVIQDHFRMVERLGLDGCHLGDGVKHLREARKDLGADAIIGCDCASSRHSGLSAAEAGADYISFGPVTASALGDGTIAAPDLFQWWSEMIEIPVMAEGGLTAEMVQTLAPISDFLAIGSEIWQADAPLEALNALLAPLDG